MDPVLKNKQETSSAVLKAEIPRTTFGAIVSFKCAEGHDLKGSDKRECREDRTWSGDSPTCVIRTCAAVEAPAHGKYVMPFKNYIYVNVLFMVRCSSTPHPHHIHLRELLSPAKLNLKL